jgi:hypothetical protein
MKTSVALRLAEKCVMHIPPLPPAWVGSGIPRKSFMSLNGRMRMRPTPFLMVALLAIVSGPTGANGQPSALEQFQALKRDYQAAEQEFLRDVGLASPGDQAKMLEQHPLYSFTGRFLEFAEKYPKDPTAVDALLWVGTRARPQHPRLAKSWETALDTLEQNHVQSDKLDSLVGNLLQSESPKGETLLRAILKNNPHRKLQGQACLALAQLMNRYASYARFFKSKEGENQIEQFKRSLGKEVTRRLREADADQLSNEAEQLLERILKEYSELEHPRGTLAKAAKSELFELRHLAIGKVAPEIEGQDIDGVWFKLSEYRGKVVVLHFWGHW